MCCACSFMVASLSTTMAIIPILAAPWCLLEATARNELTARWARCAVFADAQGHQPQHVVSQPRIFRS